MPGFGSSLQVHAFLKDHNLYLSYTDQDLDRDLETARKFSAQWSSSRTTSPLNYLILIGSTMSSQALINGCLCRPR